MTSPRSPESAGRRREGEVMVHVMSVHWRSDQWIDIQRRYLDEHIGSSYRVYASLDELPRKIDPVHYYQCELEGDHDEKLDHLAQMIMNDEETRDDDWLLFLDGDAFPVADVVAYGEEKLAEYPLVAVQRFENNQDIQPHPCFCLTTVGYWREIGGTWKPGYEWTNPQGRRITDVGGDLLGILEERGDAWCPMLRSNEADLHPVFFAVYDGLVYHHGAGFRKGCSRQAIEDKKEEMKGTLGYRVLGVLHRLLKHEKLKGLRTYVSHEYWARRQAISESQRLSRQVFRDAATNNRFHERL